MNWRDRITSDSGICHGRVRIKGTQVMVSVILDNLAAKVDASEILKLYPSLIAADIDASVAYAAELARERVVPSAA